MMSCSYRKLSGGSFSSFENRGVVVESKNWRKCNEFWGVESYHVPPNSTALSSANLLCADFSGEFGTKRAFASLLRAVLLLDNANDFSALFGPFGRSTAICVAFFKSSLFCFVVVSSS